MTVTIPGMAAPQPSPSLVGPADVLAARRTIGARLHRTPVVRARRLGDRLGIDLRFKLECFQKTGSFKPRGVLTRLASLSAEEKRRGVVSMSAGNHAQALSWAAAADGMKAVIVMPATAAPGKVEATKGYGGEVVLTSGGLREAMEEVRSERALTVVHPFEDPLVIAGQGTLGLEVMEDVPEADLILAGIGGGGLVSGIAVAAKGAKPGVHVVGVEPEGAQGMTESLAAGRPVTLDRVDTVADGLAAPFAGPICLAHVKALVDRVAVVTDREIVDALRLILERVKVLAEPAAAAPLAALLSGKVKAPKGATVVCVVSGGNADLGRLKALL